MNVQIDGRALSRRSVIAGVTGTVVGFLGASLGAKAALVGHQAEWAQQYVSDPQQALERSRVPLLSQQTIDATVQAVQRYQALADQGGWQSFTPKRILRIGMRGPDVQALRRRLMVTNDLGRVAGMSENFDSFVDAGVRRFQARHGLAISGTVDRETLRAMNVPVAMRLQQLTLNSVRLREYQGIDAQRYVVANIPAARVETVENNEVITRHKAGVGRIDRPSPIMQTKAIQINFNPFWTVPASIIKKDLIPLMQKHPHYLQQNRIRIFDKSGQEVPASAVNWDSYQAEDYRFRQDSGAGNALGVVRININNPYGVYMHDTNEKGVFGDDYRFVSSGCMRLQDVRDYVTWLLKDNPGWDRQKVDDTINSGQQLDVDITPPVPVYWVYITAWATPDGIVQFRDDVYKRDGLNIDPAMSPSKLAREELAAQQRMIVAPVQQN